MKGRREKQRAQRTGIPRAEIAEAPEQTQRGRRSRRKEIGSGAEGAEIAENEKKGTSAEKTEIAEGHWMNVKELGEIVLGSAIAVHRELGPGLLEVVYEVVLTEELKARGLQVERQVPIAIVCRGFRIEEAFRADIVVEGKLILELKAVEKAKDVHRRQLLTYLKLTGAKLGYLLNFGKPLMKDGITRLVNGLDSDLTTDT